jgi:hypothetical protein
MSRVLIGWILLAIVCGLSTVAARAVPRRWGFKGLLVVIPVQLGPAAFTAWALAQFGVVLLGGGDAQ